MIVMIKIVTKVISKIFLNKNNNINLEYSKGVKKISKENSLREGKILKRDAINIIKIFESLYSKEFLDSLQEIFAYFQVKNYLLSCSIFKRLNYYLMFDIFFNINLLIISLLLII